MRLLKQSWCLFSTLIKFGNNMERLRTPRPFLARTLKSVKRQRLPRADAPTVMPSCPGTHEVTSTREASTCAHRFPGRPLGLRCSQGLLAPTGSSSDRCPRSSWRKPGSRRRSGRTAGASEQPAAPSPRTAASVRPGRPDGAAGPREEAARPALRPLGAGRDRPGCSSGTAGPRDGGRAWRRPPRASGPGLQRSWAIL